jgi:hypothetical protein
MVIGTGRKRLGPEKRNGDARWEKIGSIKMIVFWKLTKLVEWPIHITWVTFVVSALQNSSISWSVRKWTGSVWSSILEKTTLKGNWDIYFFLVQFFTFLFFGKPLRFLRNNLYFMHLNAVGGVHVGQGLSNRPFLKTGSDKLKKFSYTKNVNSTVKSYLISSVLRVILNKPLVWLCFAVADQYLP